MPIKPPIIINPNRLIKPPVKIAAKPAVTQNIKPPVIARSQRPASDFGDKISKAQKIKELSNSNLETLEALDKYDPIGEEEEFLKTLDDIMASSSHVMLDPRMDVRELPMAKNSYEFFTGKKFLNFSPYARQLEFVGKLNLCVCPYCSPDFYDDPHNHLDPYQSYPKYFQYFENGKCPSCNRSRYNAIQDGELDEKYILVGIAGQRCACTYTIVMTTEGPVPIATLSDFESRRRYLATPVGNADMVDYFDQGEKQVFRVTTKQGRFIDITGNHRLFFAGHGYLHLERKHRKEKVFKRGYELEVSGNNIPLRKFSCRFAEPNITQAETIAYGNSLAVKCYEKIINKSMRVQEHTMEWMREKLGKMEYGNNVTGQDINYILDCNASWLWGIENKERRDCFFLGLANYSCSNDQIWAILPYPWINAYFAWLDELGIEAHQANNVNPNGSVLLKLDLKDFNNAEMPLEYLFGEAMAVYIKNKPFNSEYIHKSHDYYKEIGKSVTILMKKFGNGEGLYEPVPLKFKIEAWEDMVEKIELFRVKALDGTIRQDVTQSFLTALDSLVDQMGQPEIGKIGIYKSIINGIKLVKTAAENLHGRKFSPVVSIVKIGKTKVCDIETQTSCFYGNGIHSHNSSKSRTAGMELAYLAHRLFMTGNPSEYYGLLGGQTLSGVITATAIEQAMRNVYGPGIKNLLEGEGPWFVEFNKWLNEKSHTLGKKLYKIQETSATYLFGNLWIGCLSPDIRTIRGRTAFCTATDELAYFDSDENKVRIGGLEVNNALMNALQTTLNAARRLRSRKMEDVVFPCHISISSIKSETDPIVTWRKRQWNNPGAVHFKLPTWKFNPDFTEEQLRIDNQTDTFDRDFGSVAPKSAGSFMNLAQIKNMLGDTRNGVKIARTEYVSSIGEVFTTAKASIQWRAKVGGMQTLLSLDAGKNGNHFGFAVSHIDEEDGAYIVDAIGEVQPLPDREIHFQSLCYNVFAELCDAFNVKVVVADRWNSLQLLQNLSDEYGLERYELQLKYKDFLSWKQEVISQLIVLPREEMDVEDAVTTTDINKFIKPPMPIAHFYQQCSSVIDTGKTVDKGSGGGYTDDLFRCVVLGWRCAQDETVREIISSLDKPLELAPVIVSSVGRDVAEKARAEALGEIKNKPISRSFGSPI